MSDSRGRPHGEGGGVLKGKDRQGPAVPRLQPLVRAAKAPSTMAQTDRDALVALYNATGGAEWKNNRNWNTNADLSRWDGVKVDTQGRVVELSLGFNNLRGPIPPELGKLSALTVLELRSNQLTGQIPPELGNLNALVLLRLYENQLSGPVPPELGNIRALQELLLSYNQLTGKIPEELGKLTALQKLVLYHNQLSGPIPPQLGSLGALVILDLSDNKLDGHIPPELGNLNALRELHLDENQLSGSIPPELGKLAALHFLNLQLNQLRGPIPPELGNLRGLQGLWLQKNQLTGHIPPELGNLRELQQLELNSNQLTGRPKKNESVSAYRRRLKSELVKQKRAEQKSNQSVPAWRRWLQPKVVEQKRAEQERVQQSRAEEHPRLEPGGTKAAPAGRVSPSGGRDSQRLFREQVASFAELDELTRKNQQSLEDIRRLLVYPATGSFPSATELTDADKLQELDRLLAMAKTLGDVASIYMEEKDMQLKEMSLGPGPAAYYNAVRSGLCNAYLAASVIGSGLVSTSKVGVMGKAGTALKLISGAVPLVGGLAGFAGAALTAGDCVMQTRRVVKITEFAADAVECSKLAKSLALRLTGSLPGRTIPMTQDAKEHRNAAGVGWGPGDSTSHEGSGLAEGVNEEAVMDWFIEEISNCNPSNCDETTPTREVQAAKRLGKRQLHKLLTAVGQGCLEGTKTAEEKANRLFLVVLPETDSRSAEIPNASEDVFVRPLESAPSHDGGVQQLAAEVEALKAAMKSTKERHHAELEALKSDKEKHDAELEALKSNKEKHHAELEALKSDKEKHDAELEALKSDKEKHHAEVEALKGTITTFEERLPKSRGGLGGSVDAGRGYIFAQEQKTETREEFDERMENPARAAARQTATTDELRVTQAYVEEVDIRLGARVAALEEDRGKKKGLRLPWRGKR